MPFPTTLPLYSNPTAAMTLGEAVHDQLHTLVNNDVVAIATKVGTTQAGLTNTPSDPNAVLSADGVVATVGTSSWKPRALVRIMPEIFVAGGTLAIIDFGNPTAIPQNFRSLIFQLYCRGDTAGVGLVSVTMRINNDGAGNYDQNYTTHAGSGVSATEALGQTSLRVGLAAGATAGVAAYSNVWVEIPHYANNGLPKVISSHTSVKYANTAGSVLGESSAGFWRGTAPVSRVLFYVNGGNFTVGTLAACYGLPAS